MANPWGANVVQPSPAVAAPTADTACPAGAATTVITSGALSVSQPGCFYPMITGLLAIALGATPPTALTVQFAIGAGAAVDTYVVAPALLVASATVLLPLGLVGANSAAAYSGAGSVLNVQVNPTAQAVTVRQAGSRAIFRLVRGPDI